MRRLIHQTFPVFLSHWLLSLNPARPFPSDLCRLCTFFCTLLWFWVFRRRSPEPHQDPVGTWKRQKAIPRLNKYNPNPQASCWSQFIHTFGCKIQRRSCFSPDSRLRPYLRCIRQDSWNHNSSWEVCLRHFRFFGCGSSLSLHVGSSLGNFEGFAWWCTCSSRLFLDQKSLVMITFYCEDVLVSFQIAASFLFPKLTTNWRILSSAADR